MNITDIQNFLENKEWKALVEKYTKESEDGKNSVLLEYLEGTEDQSIYNAKHIAVEQLKIAIELRSELEKIDLPASREFVKFIDTVISDYEKRIKGTLVADMPVFFSKTDIEIRKASTKLDFIKWIDNEIEKLKKPKKDDDAFAKIEEN
jgi:hypothetical protein